VAPGRPAGARWRRPWSGSSGSRRRRSRERRLEDPPTSRSTSTVGQVVDGDAACLRRRTPRPRRASRDPVEVWTTYASSLGVLLSSTSFIPRPTTRPYSTSGGRCETQLLITSSTAPPSGKNSGRAA
jgi:hypothetical protein